METEDLERLLAKELDGELTPEEAERLAAETDGDPGAEHLAASWRESGAALREFLTALGGPSAEARARVLTRASSARGAPPGGGGGPRFALAALAAAACLLLALAAGFAMGAAVRPRRERVAAEPQAHDGVPSESKGAGVFADAASAALDGRRGEAPDVGTLRDVLRETRELMPERVRWAALCGGELNLGTTPLPLAGGGAYYFVTYFVERSDRPRPMVCQIAVLDGEEASVAWESDGRWSVLCRPVGAGKAVRLSTRVSYRPEGSLRGVALAAEPTVPGKERTALMSTSIGGIRFAVSAVVERGGEPAAGGGTEL